jgi:uncharacterized SAM-binding protein YcdF (DUF218 family)
LLSTIYREQRRLLLTNFIAAFLLPPLNALAVLILGLVIQKRSPRLAKALILISVVLLWLLATPLVGGALKRSLEGSPVSLVTMKQAQAIVVLGGGRDVDSPEYGEDTVGAATLLRLRFAVKLHRDTGLPLLVSGGKPDGGKLSEAETMRKVLTSEFNVPVRWLEEVSVNTNENARLSATLLKRDGIDSVLVVTQAWHMPRALNSFSKAGINAIPAPTSFRRNTFSLLDLLPLGYEDSRQSMHEYLGLIWYQLRR